jgi:hypothetical protein
MEPRDYRAVFVTQKPANKNQEFVGRFFFGAFYAWQTDRNQIRSLF